MQRRPAGEGDPAIVPEGWHIHWVEVGPASTEKPITISSRDPLLGVLSEIADVPCPTRVLVQVIARSDTTIRKQLGLKSADLRAAGARDTAMRYQHTQEAKTLEERGSRSFLQVVIRVAAISPHSDRARSTVNALANTICNQFGPENPVIILASASSKKTMNLAARPITSRAMRSWADNEIVALAHLPGGDALKFAPLLSTGSAKSLHANPDLRIPIHGRVAQYEVHSNG
jgi:predicted pyridoxine 5'-phosphate oxidase superfamily flavin-nucleotide-binding protein